MGTSYTIRKIHGVGKDHPHACGDKIHSLFGISFFVGSSPRVWGQDHHRVRYGDGVRIIPTRVGTSLFCQDLRYTRQNHPHACGDKPLLPIVAINRIGSSPRVWGQGNRLILILLMVRIIPTRVGTSFGKMWRKHIDEDHPHACGDKMRFELKAVTFQGSSPRVWGQVFFIRSKTARFGIIPTRVGTS